LPDIIRELNWVDFLFIILLLGILYEGLRWGASGQLLSLIGWVCMLFASVTYYSPFSEAILGDKLQKWSLPFAFFLLAGGVFGLVMVLESSLKIKKDGELSFTQRIGGAIVAAVKSVLILGIVAMLLLLTPVDSIRKAVREQSKTAMFFVETDAEVYSWMTGQFNLTRKKAKDEVINEFLSPKYGWKWWWEK
jgi:uncharacterized membrane protein required for colicin V production